MRFAAFESNPSPRLADRAACSAAIDRARLSRAEEMEALAAGAFSNCSMPLRAIRCVAATHQSFEIEAAVAFLAAGVHIVCRSKERPSPAAVTFSIPRFGTGIVGLS